MYNLFLRKKLVWREEVSTPNSLDTLRQTAINGTRGAVSREVDISAEGKLPPSPQDLRTT